MEGAMERERAYLSRLHFILKRMQHRKPLKAHKDARTLAGENVSKIKEQKRMETRKEREREAQNLEPGRALKLSHGMKP